MSLIYSGPMATLETYPRVVLHDATCLPNPHSVTALRALDGRDAAVRLYLLRQAPKRLAALLGCARAAWQRGQSVAFGCVGGRHRSVALAEMLHAQVNSPSPHHLGLGHPRRLVRAECLRCGLGGVLVWSDDAECADGCAPPGWRGEPMPGVTP